MERPLTGGEQMVTFPSALAPAAPTTVTPCAMRIAKRTRGAANAR